MLWFDRGGLEGADYASLSEHVGQRRPRVLAWAVTADGIAVGLPDRLAVRDPDGWQNIPWDEVLRGGWDSTKSAFTWTLTDGTTGGVEVSEPGRLPELFRERVNASVVVNHPIEDKLLKGTTIVARRNPATPRTALSWQVIPPAGQHLSGAARAAADAELARIRAEYDIA